MSLTVSAKTCAAGHRCWSSVARWWATRGVQISSSRATRPRRHAGPARTKPRRRQSRCYVGSLAAGGLPDAGQQSANESCDAAFVCDKKAFPDSESPGGRHSYAARGCGWQGCGVTAGSVGRPRSAWRPAGMLAADCCLPASLGAAAVPSQQQPRRWRWSRLCYEHYFSFGRNDPIW